MFSIFALHRFMNLTDLQLIVSALVAIVVGIVAVVAGRAGGSVQIHGMTVAAGRAAVVDTAAALVRDARVRTVIRSIPVACAVAGGAVRPEHPGVEIGIGVTGNTGGRHPRKLIIDMASFARQAGVGAGQREVAQAMIERGILPIERIMTTPTIRPVLAIVFVVPAVARITIRWCASVLPIDVALVTGCFSVLAFQLERGQIVIEGGVFPIG